MKTLFKTHVAVCFLLAAATAIATEPLSFKWEEGESVQYLMTQKMVMNMNAGPAGVVNTTTDQVMWMNWNVKEVEESGEALIAQGFDRIKMSTKSPMGGLEYDSAADEAATGMATLVAPMFDALVDNPIDVVMQTTGAIADIEFSDELAETFKRMPGGSGSTDMISQMVKQGTITFPSKPLEIGESWTQVSDVTTPQVGKMKVTATYTYNGPKEVDGKNLESISQSVEMQMPENANNMFEMDFKAKESDGEILFDNELGMVHSNNIKQVFDITITMQGQVIKNEMTQTIEMRQLTADELAAIESKQEAAVTE